METSTDTRQVQLEQLHVRVCKDTLCLTKSICTILSNANSMAQGAKIYFNRIHRTDSHLSVTHKEEASGLFQQMEYASCDMLEESHLTIRAMKAPLCINSEGLSLETGWEERITKLHDTIQSQKRYLLDFNKLKALLPCELVQEQALDFDLNISTFQLHDWIVQIQNLATIWAKRIATLALIQQAHDEATVEIAVARNYSEQPELSVACIALMNVLTDVRQLEQSETHLCLELATKMKQFNCLDTNDRQIIESMVQKFEAASSCLRRSTDETDLFSFWRALELAEICQRLQLVTDTLRSYRATLQGVHGTAAQLVSEKILRSFIGYKPTGTSVASAITVTLLHDHKDALHWRTAAEHFKNKMTNNEATYQLLDKWADCLEKHRNTLLSLGPRVQLRVADWQAIDRWWRAEEAERRYGRPFREKWNTVRMLGRGAFGEVHEVLTDTGNKCAAKTIYIEGKDIKKLVDAEKNLCRLIHRNIVSFLGIFHQEASVVLFMELLDGVTLKNVIHGEALKENKIECFSFQICSALSYMHSLDQPVIHRDINGSNIMVLADGIRVKLIDFGLSIELTATHLTGSTMNPKGTWRFMAPELFGTESNDKVVYSKESDIWAFGCTVYQMTTGSVPHAGCNNMYAFPKLLETKGAPDLPAGCSIELKNFYGCCVDKDRTNRKSVSDLLSHRFLNKQVQVGVAGESK